MGRIRKIYSVASQTTLYYHNHNWQVLCEYNGSDEVQRWFVYGNYIDEVLAMGTGTSAKTARLYIHDHLYSPAALVSWNGTVLERYEYDAYGNPYILDAQYAPRTTSNYGNPYLFTGRRADYLDSGSLKIQYNRNRYYDYYTGRWLTHDPLGITPNPQRPNYFDVINQYKDGLSLYEYVRSEPVQGLDAYGLLRWSPLPGTGVYIGKDRPKKTKNKCGICGPDVTGPLSRFKDQLTRDFNSWPWWKKHAKCFSMWGFDRWEICQLHSADSYPCCATGDCEGTVAVHGKCYSQHAVNYYMWGVMNSLCYSIFARADAEVGLLWPIISGDRGCKREWAKAGIEGRTTGVNCPEYSTCKMTCEAKRTQNFQYRWHYGVPILPISW